MNLAATIVLALVLVALAAMLIPLSVGELRWHLDARPRAWEWAARRGVTLTPRSVPFVGTYLGNARGIRLVCGIGAIGLALTFTAGTGVNIVGGVGFVWVLGGYLAGSVWAELSLARVPASTTRVASLVARETCRYRAPWVRWGQVAAPLVVVALGLGALAWARVWNPLALYDPGETSLYRFTGSQVVAAVVLALASLAVTAIAQRRIVGRPQPRSEPDLVAADEAMRTAAVHLLGVTHILLCLLLVISPVNFLGRLLPGPAGPVLWAVTVAVLAAAPALWVMRVRPPGRWGGAVAPPPFPPEAADAIEPADDRPSWRAPARPDLAAAAVIVVLSLGLWGLQWWGPLNPDVAAWVSGAPPSATGNPATTGDFTVLVTNRSKTDIDVLAVYVGIQPLWPSQRTVDLTRDYVPGAPRQRVSGGTGVSLAVTVPRPPCPQDVPTSVDPGPVTVDIATAAGRHLTLLAQRTTPVVVPCDFHLPTGPQPADPVGAEAAVRAAHARVYDGHDDFPGKAGLIDHPDGLAAMSSRASQSQRAPTGVHAVITHFSFDRPDHAWLIYEWRSADHQTVYATQRGEAVLLDGQWKLTRGTICQDLALVGERCP